MIPGIVGGVVFSILYIVAARVLRVGELDELLAPIKRKLKRS
jgi:hypothetical protein